MDNEDINETPAEKLDKELANQVNKEKRIIEIQAAISRSSGPIPPPETLKAYDLVKPGLAGEIFEMAKNQSQHRIEMEKTVIVGDSKRSWAGLIFGFIITLVSIGTGAFLIQQGHDIAGAAFAGTPIVSIVTAFIYGTDKRSQERIKKQKALLEAGVYNNDKDDESD
ncbi:DUF2335 domain-containing protein [Dendronalium sp. ChiSLP03b]|uniref:DUF2335 domain-containing protein n=1 Tax=Dendronalium sp. ChiSLP03b TaxID=3075381 RepID=UPI00391D22AA